MTECQVCEVGEKAGNGALSKSEFKKELLPILVSGILFALGIFLERQQHSFLELSVFLLAYLTSGYVILRKAVGNILKGDFFEENFLITVATLGAIAIHELPEAVAVMLFFRVGEFLQNIAVNRSRRTIKSLLEIKADYVNLKDGKKIRRVEPEKVKVGDIIIVKPGEKIALDGVVVEGTSIVDVSALTGESVPIEVSVGDEVLSGSINISGLIFVRVTKPFAESTVSRILKIVEEAAERKAKTEKFITRFARYYTPAVITLAAMIAAIPPLIFSEPVSPWIYRALVLLVISCPCALVLSIPLSYFSGIGRAARDGILIKGSNFIDVLSKSRIIAFDKTGTLTKGVFRVVDVVPKNGFTARETILYAAIAEMHSNHPIARAIKDVEISLDTEVTEYEEIPGHGVRAKVNGLEILVGNDRMLHLLKIAHDSCDVGNTVAHVVVNGVYAGYIVISDEIKEDAKVAVEELRKDGCKVIMVTGDNRDAAMRVAKELKIDEFYAELLPEDKVRVVEELRKMGYVVFVGDGINDAPVIARADVGVAMGAMGSDAAIEVADVVIMDDMPSKVVRAIKISKKTGRIVRQNIFLSIGVKFVFMMLGIFAMATMWEAVFADVGVTLVAVLNSMRILRL